MTEERRTYMDIIPQSLVVKQLKYSDWEYLITKSPLPKHSVTGLVLHRLTGKKGFLVWDITISVNIFLFTRSGNSLITKVKSSEL